ncbi:MAG: agmatine deiminase family protein [Acidobacteriota bacterium]
MPRPVTAPRPLPTSALIFSLLALLGLLFAPSAAPAGEARIVPPEVLDAIEDDDLDPLPRSATAREQLIPLPLVDAPLRGSAPLGPVDTPAEYEPNDGLLIRWGNFNDVLTAMAVGISTADESSTVWIFVASASQQSSAAATLAGAGADMDQIEFLIRDTDSVWMRDYGPRFVSDAGTRTIVDHEYNRPRPFDNAVPDYLAQTWSIPDFDIPLVHGGGNFHLFGDGTAFMTDLILAENPGLTEQQVIDYFRDYEGLDLTLWPALPASFDATQHIDMWMLPVRDGVAIVNEYDPSTGTPHTVTETFTAELETRGYTVHRIRGRNASGTHYTYANSVIFNDIVFIPEYDPYPVDNAAAVTVYETAFPNHQIIPVDASFLVQFAGVLHCIVMHVPSDLSGIFFDGFESGNLSAWTVD